jgi:type I restriction enzyme R subunit
MSAGAEYTEVELPLIDQLEGLGWDHIEGSKYDPAVTERSSFREVLLSRRLRDSLRRINIGPDNQPWLDEARLSEAVSVLERGDSNKLIEINQHLTRALLEGTTVNGLPGWDQGRDQRVHFIDWTNPENNDLLVISQFRVDEPGGQTKKWVAPDAVLFVNGIPVVVVECKSPYIMDPMAEAIRQLRRYANQRDLGTAEGSERLFWTNQFVISTYGDGARVATFTAELDHFLEWKDPAPESKEDLAAHLGKAKGDLTSQEMLIAGMLAPANLLDIVQHFTLFSQVDGRTIKIVTRYQQYRAVRRALDRLRDGKTRLEHGESDRRGGLIWHTQGSGKSLTMVFLVRAMRSDVNLRRFKVVVVTDRTDLEKQLFETAALSGDVLEKARKAKQLRKLLSTKGPALVFAMIQKYRDTDAARSGEGAGLAEDESVEEYAVLNEDAQIVVLVDEAHRSQGSVLHANLMAALPNAAKIGFTGTPIIRADKKRTEAIFGPFIDKYTIQESEADGATVPILYEGRTAKGAIQGATDLDQLFEDMLGEHTSEQMEALKKRYATTGSVLEAPSLIGAKARSMLLHYVSTVMPGGFKAQVAASSRLAAVRYRNALLAARDALVEDIEALPPDLVARVLAGQVDSQSLDRRQQLLVQAEPHLHVIRLLDFVPVISGDHNDDPTWASWTDRAAQDQAIGNFKKRLGEPGGKTSPVAFLIVKSMLLTGFDAPIEQVLYLDRFIQDAELLQAIARVNRTAPGKRHGLLVDYYGVGAHLQKALAAYAPEDTADSVGVLQSVAEELPKLSDRHARVVAVFAHAGIERFDSEEDVEACVQVLADEQLRARFDVALKQFLTTLDVVMPRPEGLAFTDDAKRFGVIQLKARRRYRDSGLGAFDASLYGEKVRALIDEHVTALDIATKIPPVSITDPEFLAKVKGLTSDRAKASEMEHALRFHIRKNFDEDPARYQKLSERLDAILDGLKDKWDQLALELEELLSEATASSASDQPHEDPVISRFYGLLESEFATTADLPDEVRVGLLSLGEEVVEEIDKQVHRVNFWNNSLAQDDMQRRLVVVLYESGLFDLESAPEVSDRLVELARANQALLAARRK